VPRRALSAEVGQVRKKFFERVAAEQSTGGREKHEVVPGVTERKSNNIFIQLPYHKAYIWYLQFD